MTAFAGRRVILCAGPGGVGKTTCASALALAAAEAGRRVCVITVDPSRRLAQALGLEISGNAHGDPVEVFRGETGSLDAILLDRRRVFDSIVERCAASRKSAAAIIGNPIYQATAERLGGALEYAAMARVQMLYDDAKYDLIVVDTPPTANALDFLEAPKRVRELLTNPMARVLAGTGRFGAKLLDLGGQVLLRQLEQLAGTHFLSELASFLREFAGVMHEFQRQGGDFEELLRSRDTGCVLVTSSADFSVREALDFLRILRQRGLHVDGVVLNRADPVVAPAPTSEEIREALAEQLRGAESASIDVAVARVLEIYEGAYAQGQRAAHSRQELASLDDQLILWSAHRYRDPPQSLEELRALGWELLSSASKGR